MIANSLPDSFGTHGDGMDCDMQAPAQGYFLGPSYSSHENLYTSLKASANRFIRLSQFPGSHIHSTISKTWSTNSVACFSENSPEL